MTICHHQRRSSMKSNVTRKPWKKVVRIAYASLIILQSVLITPALTYASSGQQPLTATLLAQRDATVSSSEVGVNKGNSNLLYVTTSTDGGVKHFSDLLL